MTKGILEYIGVGFRLWILKSVGTIILIVPSLILFGTAFSSTPINDIPKLGINILITLFISFILGLMVNGWLINRYKQFVLKNA